MLLKTRVQGPGSDQGQDSRTLSLLLVRIGEVNYDPRHKVPSPPYNRSWAELLRPHHQVAESNISEELFLWVHVKERRPPRLYHFIIWKNNLQLLCLFLVCITAFYITLDLQQSHKIYFTSNASHLSWVPLQKVTMTTNFQWEGLCGDKVSWVEEWKYEQLKEIKRK